MSRYICRLCAVQDTPSSFTDIFHHNSLPKIVEMLLDVQIIKEEQGTPVCLKCFRLTNEFYSFLLLVQEGQKKLESLKYSHNHIENPINDFPLEPIVKLKIEDLPCDSYTNGKQSEDNLDYYEEPLCDESIDLENEVNEREINSTSCDENAFSTYPEMFRDGKLVISKNKLNKLLKRFYKMECDACKSTFSGTFELFNHYKNIHGVKGYISCCGIRMHSRKRIVHHMGQHIQPSAFECPECKKYICRPSNLRLHLKTHLPDNEKPFKCDECGKSYAQKHHLESHKMTHIPFENRDSYPCEFCGKVYTLPHLLKTHISLMHRSKRSLCSECGKSFKTLNALKSHMLCHDKEGKNSVKCEICGIICKNALIMKQHVRIHSDLFMKCELCEFKTHRRGYLTKHMHTKHTNNMPFECSICKKLFKLKSYMESHMAQHTGEKKYMCPHCPKSFANSGNFSKHKKRMHPVESSNIKITSQIHDSLHFTPV